jgi:hypothetical protein
MPCWMGVLNSMMEVGMNTVISSASINGMKIVSMMLMRSMPPSPDGTIAYNNDMHQLKSLHGHLAR